MSHQILNLAISVLVFTNERSENQFYYSFFHNMQTVLRYFIDRDINSTLFLHKKTIILLIVIIISDKYRQKFSICLQFGR